MASGVDQTSAAMGTPPKITVALRLLAAAVAATATVAKGSGAADPLATYEVTLKPSYVHKWDDPASDYQAVWLYPKSPTTPYRSPDSFKQRTRYLLLDRRHSDADGRVGNDDWWFIIERNWPASYQASNHGKWGRETNFHNVAGDAGPNAGIGWGFGRGVSSLALDWLPSRKSPSISVDTDATARDMALPVPTRDAWHTYVVHWVAGRTDGSTLRPGSIKVWVDGEDTPSIDRANINTVQRAQGPDGKWYTQRWMQLWEGDYTSALPVTASTRIVLTRIGKSLDEALADRPVLAGTNLSGQYYRGSGRNEGPPTVRSITSRVARQALIPLSLGASAAATRTAPPASAPATAKGIGIRWAGRRYASAKALRTQIEREGRDWETFVRNHSAVARTYGLRAVSWDGRRFYSSSGMARYLADRGLTYRGWAIRHKAGAAMLWRNHTATAIR
jgi:hypothetical protein